MRKSKYYSEQSLSLKFYDALTACDGSISGDIVFYGQELAPDEQVLEIGSGTGRVAFGLAERGLRVIGVDMSKGMVGQARYKQSLLPASIATRVQFVEANAENFSLPTRVQRVLFPFYTFNFLENRKARLAALDRAATHLDSGGCIFLHCIPVERLTITRRPGGTMTKPDLTIPITPDGQLELYWRGRHVDSARQVTSQTILYQLRNSDSTVAESSEEELVFHWVTDAEVAVLARKIGLKLLGIQTSFSASAGSEKIYRLLK